MIWQKDEQYFHLWKGKCYMLIKISFLVKQNGSDSLAVGMKFHTTFNVNSPSINSRNNADFLLESKCFISWDNSNWMTFSSLKYIYWKIKSDLEIVVFGSVGQCRKNQCWWPSNDLDKTFFRLSCTLNPCEKGGTASSCHMI